MRDRIRSSVMAGRRFRRIDHSLEPFYRNAYALIVNTGVTGVLGLAYWFLAARHYDDADVGRGSAAISALMLLSGLVSVNAAGTLNRFIPQSGRRTLGLVVLAYLLTSGAVAVLTVAFFATLPWWGPAFDLLRDSDAKLWFFGAAVAASVFTVQDSVLTGLRSAVWVPVKNGVFGLAKIALLIALAEVMPRQGVFFSWIIPMIVVLFPANLLVFGRLLPRHVQASSTNAVDVSRTEIGRFFAADYVGAVFLFATVYLVPVLVATRVEPHTYAYFYLAWAIGSVMNLVAVGLATSLAVEGVYDASSLARNCRAALSRALGLLLVGAVGLGLVAPYGLRLLGTGYLDAAPLLQLLAFATLPRAVVDIYLGALRALNQCVRITSVQAIRGVLVLGMVIAFGHYDQVFLAIGLPRITAVGAAVLISQLIVMLVVLPGLGRLLGWGNSAGSVSTEPGNEIRPMGG